jgi:protein required for attachment to host cells
LPHGAWVVVCDGGKALFFQNDGDAQALNLTLIDQSEQHHPPARDLRTDRPGRTYDSHDGSRSAVAATDHHQVEEVHFLKGVALRLDELVRTHAVAQLLIIAPPRAMGTLIPHLSPRVSTALASTITRDYVKLPKPDLEARLAALSELPAD